MEDRHAVVAALQAAPDGVQRSYAAVFDGHNGIVTAELAAARLHAMLAADPAVRGAAGVRAPPAAVASEAAAVGGALERCFLQVGGRAGECCAVLCCAGPASPAC
jgi:hypothetical protein